MDIASASMALKESSLKNGCKSAIFCEIQTPNCDFMNVLLKSTCVIYNNLPQKFLNQLSKPYKGFKASRLATKKFPFWKF